jgi:transcriptional regulator with XRE-family HTH domain
MNHRQAFGQALREIRTALQLSQDELAYRAGIDRTYVSILELGQKSPTLDVVFKIAHGLGLPPSDLLARTEAHMSYKNNAGSNTQTSP